MVYLFVVILHWDQRLEELFAWCGIWIYGILFLIVFAAPALVPTAFSGD